MKTLIAILILFTAVAVYTDTRAAEWNQKPVICAQWDIVKAGLQERGEILMVNAQQSTTVYGGKDTLSDIPAFLPMSIWVNPFTKSYTILEFHPMYESHCIISFGTDWKLEGENL